ncbi:MAG: GntR family transcriptional regulator [Rubrobacteraceae bacterium]|uniref:GntR family transcriptional regulator n=1 Tax=Rubrobacter naiadicus TaxID=1392641 RepID=UPI00235F7D95|nr:GntR family transcriptional regulator [Rubrobacter naiadicus]MBX6762491.1 GntR family transcriptional regulator [Rubrobacteraceae bacterium]MCL6438620.1 GntR family transcriptional regulator [Rubrobacteraceae bacterium]
MKLNRTVLREQIKEELIARLLSGEYAPGERLVETQLAREFGTSQAPVREALRELELLRFVESEPFRGARVREVTLEELLEIYPVRAALEELAARLAAARLGGAIGAFEKEFEAMKEAAGAGDLHELVRHDVSFHRLIVESSGNRTLKEVWDSLRIGARTIITVVKTDIDLHELAEMHRPLLDALEEKDPEKAGAALRWHFTAFEKMMKGARPE